MFTPSQNDVRTFFCTAWRKHVEGTPRDAMETLAAGWIAEHPEYHAIFLDLETALATVYHVEEGQTNPFLHIAMHLSISEQCSIDQPRGIRAAVERLAAKRDSLHTAHHEVMDCLGEMIWASQRAGLPPDPHAYLDKVLRRASS
ncbi:MAG: DUF1841 family protein [Leptothrix ochracea]|uniref:DUF1841 family protein n=1 Tax=Leptothrix ochracea TaxID=735331 RepID=UPI0034E25E88